MNLEELSAQLDGTRSIMIGRAYRKPVARLVARLRHAPADTVHVVLMNFSDGALELAGGPYVNPAFELDSLDASFEGSTFWPVLLGPDALRRQLELFDGPEVSPSVWISRQISQKLPTSPSLPSKLAVDLLYRLAEEMQKDVAASSEENGAAINGDRLIQAALTAQLFSEATLRLCGLRPSRLLLEHMLRQPDARLRDLADRFMDEMVAANMNGAGSFSPLQQ